MSQQQPNRALFPYTTLFRSRVTTVADAIERAREGGLDVVVLDTSDGDVAVRALVAELERLPDAPPLVLVSESPDAPEMSAQDRKSTRLNSSHSQISYAVFCL